MQITFTIKILFPNCFLPISFQILSSNLLIDYLS